MEGIVQALVLLSTALGLLSAAFGISYTKSKKLVGDLAEAFTATHAALIDDKVDATEMAKVAKEWEDVVETAKSLLP